MDFEGLVKRYTSLSDNIKESSKTMRELRKKSNELGDAILEYMKKHDIEEAHVEGGGKLVRRVSRRTGPLSAQVLAAELKQHVPEERIAAVIERMMARRETSEYTTLRRTKT